jgi:hypothetical protein
LKHGVQLFTTASSIFVFVYLFCSLAARLLLFVTIQKFELMAPEETLFNSVGDGGLFSNFGFSKPGRGGSGIGL